MSAIILLDDQPERAQFVRSLLQKEIAIELREVTSIAQSTPAPAIALVHWSLLNRAYSELAQLRGRVEMLFYSLCAEMRVRGRVHLLPEELDKIVSRISELQRL